MKVLHIIPSLTIGGAERLTFDICNELNKRKDVDVRLFIFKDKNDFGERSFIQYIPASISLSIYKKNRAEVELLQQAIEEFAPDVIHTHLFLSEIVSRSCNYPKAKWFSHFHDNMPQLKKFNWIHGWNKSSLFRLYEKRYLYKQYRKNGGNDFIAISQNAFDYARGVVPEDSKIHYLKNAIDYNAFYHPVRKHEGKPFRLVNAGNFHLKKNQQFLVDVMEVLVEQNQDVELVLLGAGWEFENVKRKVAEKQLQHCIKLEGNVSNVKDYLIRSDLYVHAAYYEPFGLVLLEGMAAGLPVVSLNGGGNTDIIKHGINGYIFDEQDAKQFADCIIQLKEDENLYHEIALKGQETAEQFGMTSYCNRLIDIYK